MKYTFEENTSLFIRAIIINIMSLCFFINLITYSARAEDTPTPDKKIEDSDVKNQPKEIIAGYAQKVIRFLGEEGDIGAAEMQKVISALGKKDDIGAAEMQKMIRFLGEENDMVTKIRIGDKEVNLSEPTKKNHLVTTMLIGEADMHRCLSVGEHSAYMGFLQADKIVFIDNNLLRERLHTIAIGNVTFLRSNIYITSDCAHRDDAKKRITFEDNVKITNVETSIDKLVEVIDNFKIKEDDKDEMSLYRRCKALSLALLKQIADDEKNEEDQDTVWSSTFIYESDPKKDKRIAEGGVEFKIYHTPSPRENENAENGTDTSSENAPN